MEHRIITGRGELVIAELPDIRYDIEADTETGYNELIFSTDDGNSNIS